MAKYSSIIEHDRVIASTKMIPLGARASANLNLTNAETTPAEAPTFPTETPDTGWVIEDISGISVFNSLNISDISEDSSSIEFSASGTKMFILDNDIIRTYSLSIAWDISSATYINSTDVIHSSTSICFNSDGTVLFVGRNNINRGSLYKYVLSTAWDITTLTYSNRISLNTSGVKDIICSDNGFNLYVTLSNNIIIRYKFLYPLELDTIYESDRRQFEFNITGFDLSPNGQYAYILSQDNVIRQYEFSTIYDISSLSYLSIFIALSEDSTMKGLEIIDDETIFIIGNNSNEIFYYSFVLYPETSEYGLMNDSGSWIDTEYVPNRSDVIIELDTKVNVGSSLRYNGIYNQPDAFSLGSFDLDGNKAIFWYGNTGRTKSGVDWTSRHKLKIDASTKTYYIDGDLISSFNDSDTNTNITANFYIFGYNTGTGTVAGTGSRTIYSLKIWEGEDLVRYYIPVEVGSTLYSATPAPSNCMIDIVNGVYYEGSGNFTFINEN